MATTPALVGLEVELRIDDRWYPVVIDDVSGGAVAVRPRDGGSFPDGGKRIVATFPLIASDWRV